MQISLEELLGILKDRDELIGQVAAKMKEIETEAMQNARKECERMRAERALDRRADAANVAAEVGRMLRERNHAMASSTKSPSRRKRKA